MTDDRTGLDALHASLAELQGLEVRVGVLQPAPTEDGDSTIAVVAAAHEYGTATVPQRSFIGATVDGKRDEIAGLQARAIDAVLGGADPGQTAKAVGVSVASMVRDKIRSNVPPPLAPATVQAKGHGQALIDSGQLLRSINSDVVEKGGARG